MARVIATAIKQAQKAHRAALEETYDGTCTVYERQQYKNPDTKVTESREAEVFSDEPCHLSYSSDTAAAGTGTVTNVPQTIKLFLAPEKVILPGSKIVVTQQGRTEAYSQSGKAAVYSSHQEILLELFRGYA